MAFIVVGPDGKEHGPVELETLVVWAQAGTLPMHAPVRDLATGATTTAGEMGELRSLYPATNYSRAPGPAGAQNAKGSAMMPTGNPDALWGYYLGWVSLLCVIGLFAAPFAFAKSVKGLKAHKQNPEIHGRAHAIIGIVLASIGTLGNLGLVILFFVNLGSPV